MSVSVMTTVWREAPFEGATLLTLLALADSANDEGICWPKLDTIAKKARQPRRTVYQSLKNLIEAGWLKKIPDQTINEVKGLTVFQVVCATIAHSESADIAQDDAMAAKKSATIAKPPHPHIGVTVIDPSLKPSPKAKPSVNPLHKEFQEDFQTYYKLKVGAKAPWNEKEAGQLSRWLKANPTITREQWRLILNNRARSPVSHAKPLSVWIGVALAWLRGPADDWGKPINGGKNGAVPRGKTDSNLAVLQELNAEEERTNGASEDGLFPASDSDEE